MACCYIDGPGDGGAGGCGCSILPRCVELSHEPFDLLLCCFVLTGVWQPREYKLPPRRHPLELGDSIAVVLFIDSYAMVMLRTSFKSPEMGDQELSGSR